MKESKFVVLSMVAVAVGLAGACAQSSPSNPGPITTGGSPTSSTPEDDDDDDASGGADSSDETTSAKGGAKSTTTKSTTKSGSGGSSTKTTTAGEEGGAGSDTTTQESGGASDGGAASTDATGGTTSTSPTDDMACEHLKLPNEKTDFLDFGTIDATKLTWGTSSGDNAGLTGGTALYHGEGDTITADASAGNLAVTISMAVQGYTGITFWFGPCLDVSNYTGISFTIGGDAPADLTAKFMVQTHADYPIDVENKKGACPWETESERWSVCAPPYTGFTVPVDATAIQVPFAELTGGTPVASVDANELVGIQFQFECSSETACEFNLTLDDIAFY